jgi:hypothetical protein
MMAHYVTLRESIITIPMVAKLFTYSPHCSLASSADQSMMPYVLWNGFGPSQFSTMVFLEVNSLSEILGILECRPG